jgi:hypothetical protein
LAGSISTAARGYREGRAKPGCWWIPGALG